MWDCDKRTYSYYIEVSLNKEDWEIVFDRSKVACRSWQLITFPRRPVVFIRIVGTHNTANEVFHCVHLECPAVSHLGNDDSGKTEPGGDRRPSSPDSASSGSSSSDDSSVDATVDTVDANGAKSQRAKNARRTSVVTNQVYILLYNFVFYKYISDGR